MGLAEDIKNALRAKAEAEANAAELAEKLAVEAEQTRLTKEAQMATDEELRVANLTESLSLILDNADARKYLEEVRKVWTVGNIDETPTFIPDLRSVDGEHYDWLDTEFKIPGVGLALRYDFQYLDKIITPEDTGEFGTGAMAYHSTSALYQSQAALYVIAGQTPNCPIITSYYALRQIEEGVFYPPTTGIKPTRQIYNNRYPDWNLPRPLSPTSGDPSQLKSIVYNQLLELCTTVTTHPADLERESKEATITDPFLTNYLKHGKSSNPQQHLPWYRRMLG